MADADSPPRLIVAGRYVLGDIVGTGGMSTVYRAHDEVLGRTVAVKILGSQSSDPALMRREKIEVALLASLNHPALVTLYDADVTPWEGGERSFLVMEFVDGPTLDARIRTGPVSHADLTRMLIDLADALHVVHRAGVVHRDIKPGNILLAPSHRPNREFSAKLADFGIASLVDSTRITATGTVVGTAAYLSPEQARGQRVGPATDIYSLGLVLLEAATGTREFPGSLLESLTARMNRDPVIPGSLGYDWKSTLTAMTARDPAVRPTAEQLLIWAESSRSSTDTPATATFATTPITVPLVSGEPSAAAVATAPLPARHSSRARSDSVRATSRGRMSGWKVLVVVAGAAAAIIAALTTTGTLSFPNSGLGPTAPSTMQTPATSGSPTSVPVPAVVSPVAPTVVPTAPSVSIPTTAPTAAAPPAAPAPPGHANGAGKGNGNGKGNGKGNGNGNGQGHK
jgi:serine/threonine protein kinase